MSYLEMNHAIKIFLIEPDRALAESLKLQLNELGHRNVLLEEDTYRALKKIQAQPPEFLFCHNETKGLTGFELFEELRADFAIPSIPSLLFGEGLKETDRRRFHEEGVEGMLVLPFTPGELAASIARTWARFVDRANPGYVFERARRMYSANALKESEALFRGLIGQKKLICRSLVGAGRVRKKQNDLEGALSFAQEAVGRYAGQALAQQFYGESLLALGRVEEAVKAFSKALDLSSENPFRYEVIGEMLMGRTLWNEAEAIYRTANLLEIKTIAVRHGLARSLANLNQTNEAIAIYSTLLAEEPKNPRYLNNLANCYKNIKDFKQAMIYYRKALDLEPENCKIMLNVAQVHWRLGEVTQAERLLQHIIGLEPHNEKARARLHAMRSGVALTDE